MCRADSSDFYTRARLKFGRQKLVEKKKFINIEPKTPSNHSSRKFATVCTI